MEIDKDKRRKLVSAKALIFDNQKRLLILNEPRKSYWSLPGGIAEAGESPRQALVREVQEELGIEIHPTFLACVDFSQGEPYDKISLTFVADLVNPDANIVFKDGEVAGYRFIDGQEALPFLQASTAQRVSQCLLAIENGRTLYLEGGR